MEIKTIKISVVTSMSSKLGVTMDDNFHIIRNK